MSMQTAEQVAKWEWFSVGIDPEDNSRVQVKFLELPTRRQISISLAAERAREHSMLLEHVGTKIHQGPVAIGVEGGNLYPTTTTESEVFS
jgi:hypothetical protein